MLIAGIVAVPQSLSTQNIVVKTDADTRTTATIAQLSSSFMFWPEYG
jgi:hypothetical protein